MVVLQLLSQAVVPRAEALLFDLVMVVLETGAPSSFSPAPVSPSSLVRWLFRLALPLARGQVL